MSMRVPRWTLVMTAAVILVLSLSWALPGCSFNVSCGTEEPAATTENPAGTTEAASGPLTYTDADYGYSFAYPSDWRLDEDSSAEVEGGIAAAKGVSAIDPKGAKGDEFYVDLFQVSIYELNITIDEAALPEVKPQLEQMIAGIGSQDPSWEVLEAMSEAEVGGLSGFKTLVTHLMDGRQVKSRLYFLFDGRTEYELMLQAATESWDAIQPDFEAILASFTPSATTETTAGAGAGSGTTDGTQTTGSTSR